MDVGTWTCLVEFLRISPVGFAPFEAEHFISSHKVCLNVSCRLSGFMQVLLGDFEFAAQTYQNEVSGPQSIPR
jgi:hypothetical protein